jgi:hypothetical protein
MAGGYLLALIFFMFEAPNGGKGLNFFNENLDTSHLSPIDGLWHISFNVNVGAI